MAEQATTDPLSPAALVAVSSPDPPELNESRTELLNRILNLKHDLQSWRGKLDTQVQVYHEELSGLKKTLNLEVEQLREEFKDLKTTLNQQQDEVSFSLKSVGLQDDSKDSKVQMVTEEKVEALLTDENEH